MKQAQEILKTKISEYNSGVSDMNKFLLNTKELKMFSDAMADFVSQFKSEWISIKDQQPKFDEKVLCVRQWSVREKNETRTVRLIDIGYLTDIITRRDGVRTEWHIGDNFDIDDVTHWMPLPELPKIK